MCSVDVVPHYLQPFRFPLISGQRQYEISQRSRNGGVQGRSRQSGSQGDHDSETKQQAKSTATSSSPKTPTSSSKTARTPLKKTAQKKLEKSQDKFAVAVDHIFATDTKEDTIWCKKQLDEHPEWVPYLTSLFRRGTFQKMMKRDAENMEAAENERKSGRLLHARIRKLDKLPTQFKIDFLAKVNTTGDFESWPANLVNKAFSWCLMIGPQTPLPPNDLFKQETPLLNACVFHYSHKVNSPMGFDLKEKPALETFDFFKLDDAGKVTFLPLQKEFTLPGGADMQWKLTDASDMECIAQSVKFKGCSQNLMAMFEQLADYDLSAPWGYAYFELEENTKQFEPFSNTT